MNKTLSIVLTSVLCFIFVFLCVFAFIPSFEYGKYNVYHPALSLIQLGGEFGGTTTGSYKVDTKILDDANVSYDSTTQSQIKKIISQRFGSMYGYFDSKVAFSNNGMTISVEIPTSTPHTKEKADTIIDNIMVRGLVELCTASTYDAESVVLSNDADQPVFGKASYTKYVDSGTPYFGITVPLTQEGFNLMTKNFAPSASSSVGSLAIDELMVTSYFSLYWPMATSKSVTVYCNTEANAALFTSLVNYGALSVELREIDITENASNQTLGTIVALIILLLVAAMVVLLFVKYAMLGISSLLSYLVSIVCVTYFAGLVSFSVLNIWAVVGFIIGLAVLSFVTASYFEKIHSFLKDGKSVKYSVNAAYKAVLWKNIIANAGALVLGILLWLIPTAVTAPLGNALVYMAIMSAVCNFGLNFVLARFFIPSFAGQEAKAYGVKQ